VGVLIDNFELTLESRAVPEPGVWALLILGFGAAGARLRRARTSMV
jgi:hypothetical protein